MAPKKRKSSASYSSHYVCPVCGKRFPDSRGLSVHMYHKQNFCGTVGLVKRQQMLKNDLKWLDPPIILSADATIGTVEKANDSFENKSGANKVKCGFDGNDEDRNSCEDSDDDNNTWIRDYLSDHSSVSGGSNIDDNDFTFFENDQVSNTNAEEFVESNLFQFSAEHKSLTRLVHLLDSVLAPDYMFHEILKWARDSLSDGFNFLPKVQTRSAYIKFLSKSFNLQNMVPTITTVQIEKKQEPVPVVHYDFMTMLMSLLMDEELMQPHNLVLNNKHPINENATSDMDSIYDAWFDPYVCPSDNQEINEVLEGSWYAKTSGARYAAGKDFVCPLIFYVDRTMIDPQHSHFNLEPLNFTLGIFKRECRTKFKFWRTLGYIPGDEVVYDESKVKGTSQRNYHKYLSILLKGVLDIHNNPTILENHYVRIGNQVRKRNIHIPVAFIMADTQGADKLCGRYISYGNNVARIHRTCYCNTATCSDLSISCTWVEADQMLQTVQHGSEAERQQVSMQHLPKFALKDVDFGENPHGIFGATPNEILHGIKLGLIKYLLDDVLFSELSQASKDGLYQACTNWLPFLRCQSISSSYVRFYFPKQLTSLSNCTADETFAIFFMLFLLMNSSHGQAAFLLSPKMTRKRMQQYVFMFEWVLCYVCFLSSKQIYRSLIVEGDNSVLVKKTSEMVAYMSIYFPRTSEEKQGWNLSKIHELRHYATFIEMFGCPSNFDTGPCECMHKEFAKKPGRKSQKRHATFTMQAANRLGQKHIVDHAYLYFAGPESKFTLEQATETPSGSYMTVVASPVFDNNGNKSSVHTDVKGSGVNLGNQDLAYQLHPDLVEYLSQFLQNIHQETFVRVCSEYYDCEGILYRAHQNYRGLGPWHDWVWIGYVDDTSDEGFTNIPAKIICFLPEGMPDNPNPLIVCHPCEWNSKLITNIIERWQLVASPRSKQKRTYGFDIVELTALNGPCFAVPDLYTDGSYLPSDYVNIVKEKEEWGDYFFTITTSKQ